MAIISQNLAKKFRNEYLQVCHEKGSHKAESSSFQYEVIQEAMRRAYLFGRDDGAESVNKQLKEVQDILSDERTEREDIIANALKEKSKTEDHLASIAESLLKIANTQFARLKREQRDDEQLAKTATYEECNDYFKTKTVL